MTSPIASSAPPVVFEPIAIPISAPEIVNPFRGLYHWGGSGNTCPLPTQALDVYQRVLWKEMEPARDEYDFGLIEKRAEAARQRGGGKYSFRIRCVLPRAGTCCPEYAMRGMDKGWWYDFDKDGQVDTYVPDWNDPFFLERIEKLLEALGQRYDGDPRIGFMDVGVIGNFGEWHMWQFPYPSSSGATVWTDDVAYRVIDTHIRCFPKTRLFMRINNPWAVYALKQSPRMGMRCDGVGNPTVDVEEFAVHKHGPEGMRLLLERWKTAPLVTEFWNPPSFQLALTHIHKYHVAMNGNGNCPRWEVLKDRDRELFIALGKACGYRFEVGRVTVQNPPVAGESLSVDTLWRNVGVTPAYEPWLINYQLRDGSNQVIWQAASKMDLEKFLPSEDKPRTIRDQFELPANLPEGDYQLCLMVTDPQQYRPPLKLAIEGVTGEGYYPLGWIHVSK